MTAELGRVFNDVIIRLITLAVSFSAARLMRTNPRYRRQAPKQTQKIRRSVKMHFRQWLLLCMLFVYAPLTPALDKPDCALIEKWATAGDAQETTQISPGLQLSVLAEDERMVPLFGKSIYSWDRDDFRDFNTTVNVCAKAASKRRDRATRDTLQLAMRSVRKAQRPLGDLIRAREAGNTAVTALLEEPASPETIVMLERAEEALQGKGGPTPAAGHAAGAAAAYSRFDSFAAVFGNHRH
ncbi:MAG: hypothetical protein HND59_02130 [Pseudomonadota bacterium]|nr:MAG: hypothetical protein HND59_02130 [Pseudomonadota bacterium]